MNHRWPPVLGAYVCHQIEYPARGRCCGLGADLVAGGPGHSQGIPTRSNTRPGAALPGVLACPPVAGGLPGVCRVPLCHQIEHPARGGVGCLVLVPVGGPLLVPW